MSRRAVGRHLLPLLLLLLLACAGHAASAQQQGEEPPPSPPPPSPPPPNGDADGAAAVLAAMAARAQQNSLSQTLLTMMALSSAEDESNSGNNTNISNSTSPSSPLLPPPLDAANAPPPTTTTTITPANDADFRNALRAHLEDLVGQQQQHFVNALGDESKKQKDNDDLAALIAKLVERRAAQGPLSIQLRDDLVLGLGRAARAATTQQPGAGPCGQYRWDAGGEDTPATWVGPSVSLSLTLGSCALVPSLEGPGAALTAGSAWTNAVGELACLGPGLAYFLSPLTYTSVGITGEALTVPACRLAATFGPSLSLRLTRSPKNGGDGGGNGGDVYSSEGQFLAGAVLNGTLDKRIRRLQRALEVAAGVEEKKKGAAAGWWRGAGGGNGGGGDGEGGQEDEDDHGDGDYELTWEKDARGGEGGGGADDGLQEGLSLSLNKAKPLLRALLGQARGGWAHGGKEKLPFANHVEAASAASRPSPDASRLDNRVG